MSCSGEGAYSEPGLSGSWGAPVPIEPTSQQRSAKSFCSLGQPALITFKASSSHMTAPERFRNSSLRQPLARAFNPKFSSV